MRINEILVEQGVAEGQDNTIYQVSRAMLDNNPGKSYLKASEDDILRDAARELLRMGMSDIRVRAIMRDPDFGGELIDTLRGPIKSVQEDSAHPQDDMRVLEYYRVKTPYGQEYVGQLMARYPQSGIELRLPDGHEKWISRDYIQSVEWLDWKDPVLRSKKDVREGHADQRRKIVKHKGQPVGEVGIDRESSAGVGQYYMRHYASGKDNSGYDTEQEALDDLRHIIKQGIHGG